jgi:hypothetical protein
MTIGQSFTAVILIAGVLGIGFATGSMPPPISYVFFGFFYGAVGYIAYFIARASGFLNYNLITRLLCIFVALVISAQILDRVIGGGLPFYGTFFSKDILPYILPTILTFLIELLVLRLVDGGAKK